VEIKRINVETIEGIFNKKDYEAALKDKVFTSIQSANEIHVFQDKKVNGAYLKYIKEGERLLSEIQVTERFRVAVSVFEVHKKSDFSGLQISKLKQNKAGDWGLDGFLKINEVDRKILQEILSVIVNSSYNQDSKQVITLPNGDLAKTFKALKGQDFSPDVLSALAENPELKNDIIALAHKRTVLKNFESMLEENFKEPEWQKFFLENQWIFGYGLQYRFQGVLQKEAYISGTNQDGSGDVIGDFLLADQKFVTFVECKTPQTFLFKKDTNRAKAWGLNGDLFDAVSQILQQKAEGEYKFKDKSLYDAKKNRVESKPYDSKAILLIGNLEKELRKATDYEKNIKLETFERFRRDSRNIEIITYDELYDRARCIIETLEKTSQ
jgi:hypothetical protein